MVFEVNGLNLECNFQKGNRGKSGVLILHGGGLQPNQAQRFLEWQNILRENGFSSFAFNHGGIWPSEGRIQDSTLEMRLIEARVALNLFKDISKKKNQEVIIMGASMGGHIAAQLAPEVNSKGLLLCQPGSFVEDAEDKPFGSQFSQVLRQDHNWEAIVTRSFSSVRKYAGNLLIISAENDTIIPKSVIARYFFEASDAKTRELYELKGAPHHYFRINDQAVNPDWRKTFYQKALSWLNSI